MKKILFLFLTLVLLTGCSSNDDSNDLDYLDGAYLTAKVNGQNFVAEGNSLFDGVHAQLVEAGPVFAFAIGAASFDGSTNTEAIGIGLGGLDFNVITAGTEYFAQQEDITVSGYYSEQDENGTYLSSESELNAYVKITAIDKVNKIVSGEFYFTAIDDDNPNILYNVTDGIFNDVQYTDE